MYSLSSNEACADLSPSAPPHELAHPCAFVARDRLRRKGIEGIEGIKTFHATIHVILVFIYVGVWGRGRVAAVQFVSRD